MSGAVTVTQADREAAVAYAAAVGWCVDLDWLRETDLPVPLTQAFARHRHAAEAASKQQVAELVDALEAVQAHWHHMIGLSSPREWHELNGKIEDALARAKATEQGEG